MNSPPLFAMNAIAVLGAILMCSTLLLYFCVMFCLLESIVLQMFIVLWINQNAEEKSLCLVLHWNWSLQHWQHTSCCTIYDRIVNNLAGATGINCRPKCMQYTNTLQVGKCGAMGPNIYYGRNMIEFNGLLSASLRSYNNNNNKQTKSSNPEIQ